MIYQFVLILILNISFLNAQVFENKRDLLNNSKKSLSNKLYLGIGVSYLNNEYVNRSSKDDKINSNIISGYNFVPNILIEYINSETSDFRFRLNFAYNSYSIEDTYNFESEIFENQNMYKIYNYSSSKFNLNSFDLDLIINYNLLGFKSVSLFSGIKLRIPENKISYDIYSVTEQGVETNKNINLNNSNINFAPIFGVSYNGIFDFIEYELYFQYISFLNDSEFKDNLNINSTSFSNSQYGIGINVKYNLINRK